MSPTLEEEIKEKHRLFRKLKRTNEANDRVRFVEQRNRVTRLLRKAERTHVITLFRQSRLHSTAAGNFFQYFRIMTGKTHRLLIPDFAHKLWNSYHIYGESGCFEHSLASNNEML